MIDPNENDDPTQLSTEQLQLLTAEAHNFKESDDYQQTVKEIDSIIEQESSVKQESHNLFIDSDLYQKPSYQEKMKRADDLTQEILSKPVAGDVNKKETLLNVLASFSKSNNKDINIRSNKCIKILITNGLIKKLYVCSHTFQFR